MNPIRNIQIWQYQFNLNIKSGWWDLRQKRVGLAYLPKKKPALFKELKRSHDQLSVQNDATTNLMKIFGSSSSSWKQTDKNFSKSTKRDVGRFCDACNTDTHSTSECWSKSWAKTSKRMQDSKPPSNSSTDSSYFHRFKAEPPTAFQRGQMLATWPHCSQLPEDG